DVPAHRCCRTAAGLPGHRLGRQVIAAECSIAGRVVAAIDGKPAEPAAKSLSALIVLILVAAVRGSEGIAAAEASAPIRLYRGSAPDPGSVARGDPCAPLRSFAGALCAPTAIRRLQREQNSRN